MKSPMKYIVYGVAAVILVVILAVVYVGPGRIGRLSTIPPAGVKLEKPTVSLVIKFSDTDIATVSATATTPYEALTLVAATKGMPVRVRQYDFGVFVESVRDISVTGEKSWIYFVNGEGGKVAADKYTLHEGDIVEWRYTKPL